MTANSTELAAKELLTISSSCFLCAAASQFTKCLALFCMSNVLHESDSLWRPCLSVFGSSKAVHKVFQSCVDGRVLRPARV